ncbi:PilZ domain-containing protein [Treponema sp.]|uniref:PilZ domain-containing protein n=1 Tax=Treponema sp. TaxID=166 RepID=UPI0025CEEDCE|nr:PilZ domain-containing protein [Treponema sp.]MCR5218781.1 PilZ domain-containing protein [Treponema sp.]
MPKELSPVNARQDSFTYLFILAALGVLLVLFIIYLILRYFKNLHSSKNWIDSHKSLPTTLKNVKALAKEASLTKKETVLLWNLCKKNEIPNIEFSYRDNKLMDSIFASDYQDMIVLENLENKIQELFSLRYKLEKCHEKKLQLKSTRSLKEGLTFTYNDNKKRLWNFTLLENKETGMTLQIPQGFNECDCKPDVFSKISMSFSTQSDTRYKMITRVIRYEKDNKDRELMVVTVSDQLQPILRRMAKRMDVESPCEFSAVKIDSSKNKQKITVLDHRYPGKLQDISATGCSLKTSLPIKKGQFLKLYFQMKTPEPLEASGQIIVTNKAQDGKNYILHVKFNQISVSAQNRIYAQIYGYDALS